MNPCPNEICLVRRRHLIALRRSQDTSSIRPNRSPSTPGTRAPLYRSISSFVTTWWSRYLPSLSLERRTSFRRSSEEMLTLGTSSANGTQLYTVFKRVGLGCTRSSAQSLQLLQRNHSLKMFYVKK